MTSSPKPTTLERSYLLLDFPIRLYTALRAIRLYPAASPQVRRCNDLVLHAFQMLRAANPGNGSVTLAFSAGKVFVCGEQLPEKDQARPQIQGLTALSNRFNLYSLTFYPSFSAPQCVAFIQTVSMFLGDSELPEEPVATILDKAGITTVSADIKRYVAIHGDEQLVQEEALHSELNVSDEELADSGLDQASQKTIHGVSTELVQELISRLPPPDTPYQHPEGVAQGVIQFLYKLTQEINHHRQAADIDQPAKVLSGLDPCLLARLVAALPPTPGADAILRSALRQLTSRQTDILIVSLVAPLAATGDTDAYRDIATPGNPLNRLVRLAQEHTPEIQKTITRNLDAQRLLLNPNTTLSELPEDLLERLHQPEWSASVLATAAQQAADPQLQAAGQVDFQASNRLLERYEELYGYNQQAMAVVARQAGAQLAAMEGLALGNILVQRFKGPFGEQLYNQVVNQISDEVLDETVGHLTPRQLNRMVAALIHSVPSGKEGRTEFKIADGALFRRLTKTRKGAEITTATAHNIDARRLLLNFSSPLSHLPEYLLKRLHQPEWSASVLAAAAQYAVDVAKEKGNPGELACLERALAACDTLIDQERQVQIASRVAAEFPSFDEQELRLILVCAYKGPFGEQLYRQVIRQLSEDKQGRLISHFQALRDPGDQAREESFKLLQETVEMCRQQKLQREEQKQPALNKRFDDLLQSDLATLTQTDMQQEALPAEIRGLLAGNQEEITDALLRQLVAAMHHELPAIRVAVFHSLAAIGERLAQVGLWKRIESLLPALQQGLRLDGIGGQAVPQAMTAIGGLADHYLAEERYPQAGEIIQILRLLSSQNAHGEAAGHLVQSQALATLKHLCSKTVLEKLMQLYLHSETQQEEAGSLLSNMGDESAKFQLQQLITNEIRFERKRILALIKQTGDPAISILQEQLHQDQPWFVVRNVIRLLGEIGASEVFATVTPYIDYPDLRVQQEVISSASKIGGKDFKDFLLRALQTVGDSLKIKVVNHIAANYDERFVRPLADLLDSTRSFPGKNKNDLQLALCKTLGIIGSRRAIAPLTGVTQSKNVLGLGGYPDEVRQAAAMALEQIRAISAARKSDDNKDNAPSPATEPIQPTASKEDSTSVEAREEAIFRQFAQGDKELAKQQLFDLVVATARAGDFKNAERLRERIYEIDNLALSEIIRAGEIIEEEKMAAIKEEDLETWSDLTDRLTSQEFQTVYHELSELRLKTEETVVNQGDKNDALFFITQGSLKVSHQTGPHELFITTLNCGQIAGENFFAPSFWTVTLTSLTPSRLLVLKQSTLDAWKEQFPGLRAKLHTYYLACNTIGSLLEKKGLDRRQDQRYDLARKIQVQPVNNRDTPVGHGFRAETTDISRGGLAFLIRISRRENARLLLGRRMQMVLPVGGKHHALMFKGIIIGIQPFQVLENDFSVHFKFDHPLDQRKLQSILG